MVQNKRIDFMSVFLYIGTMRKYIISIIIYLQHLYRYVV